MDAEEAEIVLACHPLHRFLGTDENRVHVLDDVSLELYAGHVYSIMGPSGCGKSTYRGAAFTVFPSRAEGFGLPILESFWHGRGVICSGHDAMGETSAGPGALHAGVAHPEDLAAALRALLENPARAVALARAAYDRPLRTWDDYGRDLAPFLDAA
jgi:energy-coupling factor transporter ATP-binding protein EcfA2